MKLIRAWTLGVLWLWLLAVLGMGNASAQTFSEWFAQKKTQRRYLLEQIAALEVYLGYAKKGYQVVDKGLSVVKEVTGGEMDMHRLFFSGLKLVSPLIKADPRVAEIVSLQAGILEALLGIRSAVALSEFDKAYVLSVSGKVLAECLTDLEALGIVLSTSVEMGDAERLTRLALVFNSVQEKSVFVQSFCAQVRLGILQRKLESTTILNMGRYYGLP